MDLKSHVLSLVVCVCRLQSTVYPTSHLHLGLPSGLLTSGFPCMHLSSLPHMPHALPISVQRLRPEINTCLTFHIRNHVYFWVHDLLIEQKEFESYKNNTTLIKHTQRAACHLINVFYNSTFSISSKSDFSWACKDFNVGSDNVFNSDTLLRPWR